MRDSCWFVPARRYLLLLGSVVFCAWSEPIFIFVVFVSAALDWLLGRFIVLAPPTGARRKAPVACGVVGNVGLLVWVKYAAFGVANLNLLLAHTSWHPLAVPRIVLPLGVSFIVFEKITYLVDLYRGVAKPAVSLLDYCNYVLLFPKLLAGPIVKYHDIAAQLSHPSHRYEDMRDGLIRFIQGLAKKTLVADTLSPVADRVFVLSAASLDPASAWLGLICFTLQIYFDFSGYTDMAIGLGRVLGFRLLENFDHPYLATSFTDFWRRWHISLSSWIKEYLYIPLGGSRVSTARSYANLSVCFLLSGLWHGASWNFVIWGGAHGCALVAERAFWLRWQKALPRGVNMALTFCLVMLTWVFFRCPKLTHSLRFFHALAGATKASSVDAAMPPPDVIFVLAIGACLVMAPLLAGRFLPAADRWFPPAPRRLASLALCAVLLPLSVARLTVGTFHPFLYFRF